MKRKTRTVTSKSRKAKAPGTMTWKFKTAATVAFLVVAGGLFFAADNHFASVNMAFGNSELRKQLADLEAEKRRLMLSREVALSPAEIRKSARSLGFIPMTASNLGTYRSSDPELAKKTAKPSAGQSVAGQVLASLNVREPVGKVNKTSLVTPVGRKN
jgi:hypothetical protein